MRSLCCSKLRHNDNCVETNYTPLSLSLSSLYPACWWHFPLPSQPEDLEILTSNKGTKTLLLYLPGCRPPARPEQQLVSMWEIVEMLMMLSVCSSALSHLGSTGWSLLQTCDTLSSAQPLLPVNRPASQGWGCTKLPTSENISEFYFRILQFQIYQIITIMTTQR